MKSNSRKKIWLALMIILYIGAGINHFINPGFYLSIIPSWLPTHRLLISISGALEIILAVLLLFPRTQHASAWSINVMLLFYLVCIHIPMVLDFNGWNDWIWWAAIIRLPIQYFLMQWAFRYSRGEVVRFW